MKCWIFKLRDIFPRFRDRDSNYDFCLSKEDWEKVTMVYDVLDVFSKVIKIISGNDYPTSNFFLNEVHKVTVLLDKKSQDVNNFIRIMAIRMKQ